MYVVWRKRPVKGKGGGPFLLGDPDFRNTYDSCPWQPLACTHRGEGRVAWTPLLVISARVDGKPRQRVLYRFPTIRTCCISDRFNRSAWWYDVKEYLDHVDESYCEEGTFLPRDRASILAKLREIVPNPTSKGRAEFDDYRRAKEAERKARDDADRAWWAKESDRQKRERAAQQQAEDDKVWAQREEQARFWREFNETMAGMGAATSRRGTIKEECFVILGLEPGATVKQIKDAYHALAKVHHPDVGGDAAAFNRIKAAQDRALRLAGKASA